MWILNKLLNKRVFTRIYKNNGFLGRESISGPGSDIKQTEALRTEIPELMHELNAKTLLDVPCGDFFWMNLIDFEGINYIGGDIVEELIVNNTKLYAKEKNRFLLLDIVNDLLPAADVLLCRDCFVHMNYRSIFKAIDNIKKSPIKYLLTTSFTNRNENINIRTGQWRPLNVLLPPLSFSEPLKVINENCTENDGAYSDKSLLLFDVKTLPDY